MFFGIASYFICWARRKVAFLADLLGVLFKALYFRVTSEEVVFNCYAQNPHLHNFSTRRNDFELLVNAIRLNCFFRNKIRVTIHLNKFNFCYLEEIIYFYLKFFNTEVVMQREDCIDDKKSIFQQYMFFLGAFNRDLLYSNVKVVLAEGDRDTIKKLFDAIEEKWRKSSGSAGSIVSLLDLFDDIKKQPHSFLTSIRYLSLFAEETILGPRQVVLDIYHKCNTDCVHCWIHSPSARKFLSKEFVSAKMDYARVRSVVDDCCDMGVDTITLLGDGEPILNPDFLPILRHIKSSNPYIDVLTFSNGLAVTPQVSNALIKSGLNEIWFSVPAATSGMYQKVCPSKTGKDFERVKKNISYLCHLKNSIRATDPCSKYFDNGRIIRRSSRDKTFSPYCVIAFVLHKINYHEITEMARMAVDLGVDEMRFQLIHLDKDNKWLQLSQDEIDFLNSKLDEVKVIADKHNIVLSAALKFQLSHMHAPTGDWSRGYYLKHGCPIGFFFSIIKANGDVGLCCSLKVIDNLKNKSFKDIWFSERYQKARVGAKYLQEHKDQEFQSTDYHKGEVRGDCLYSERCELCDNHDMNNEVIHCLSKIKQSDMFMKKHDLHEEGLKG